MTTEKETVNTCERLKELSKPLVEYIRTECNPYTKIVITGNGIYQMGIELGIPFSKGD
jgi:D-ribose pyranose/furanose isomerase RbsD